MPLDNTQGSSRLTLSGENIAKLELSTLRDIQIKINALIQSGDTPDITSMRTLYFPTKFDFKDIEKYGLKPGVNSVVIGSMELTRNDFIKIKGMFQLHRFHHARMLWTGSNELNIRGCESMHTLKEMIESSVLYKEIIGIELATDRELDEMLQIIKEKEKGYPNYNGWLDKVTLQSIKDDTLKKHENFI